MYIIGSFLKSILEITGEEEGKKQQFWTEEKMRL